jgi:hypothetical protein
MRCSTQCEALSPIERRSRPAAAAQQFDTCGNMATVYAKPNRLEMRGISPIDVGPVIYTFLFDAPSE